ncbi:MAG: hypothetical protein RLZZ522_235 [Verrucomicrobiota bacterium]
MKTALIVSLALLSVPLHAQTPAIPVPPNPRPQLQREQPAGLDRNLTIHLAGNFTKDLGVDVAVTGIGPTWTTDTFVGDDYSNLTSEYQVTEIDGAFRVIYSVGVRVAIPAPQPAIAPGQPPQPQSRNSVSYQNMVVRGAITCKLGEPVEIIKNGKQRVCLTLLDPAAPESAPARSGK